MTKKTKADYREPAVIPFLGILIVALIWLALDQNFAVAQRTTPQEQPQQRRTLHLQFSGETRHPLSMVAGDFDEDGIRDLVIGYGLQKGGSLTLLRGNLDAHAPQSYESWLAAGRHQYSDPYLQSSKPVSLTTQPSLMVSADVNGDGHQDLVYATRGSKQLSVAFGDGKGNFSKPIITSLGGGITALAAYRPGAPLLGEAIVAGYQVNQTGRLSVVSYSANQLATRATYALPAAATAMSVANLDSDLIPDTAVVSGGKLLILHGKSALSGHSTLTTLPVSDAETVTTGEFLFDRHAQLQLSVLTTNGDVVTLAHEGFDPRPYTPQQIAETRREQRGRSNTQTLAQQAGNTGNAPWVEVERNSDAAVHASSDKAPLLLRSRSSRGSGDDLVVLNSSQQQKTLISHSLAPSRSLTGMAPLASGRTVSSRLATSNIVAAVSISVSPDARDGLVVLSADSVSPDITLPSAGNTFYVNTVEDNTGTTTDPSDGTRCTQGAGEVCTLRDAITFANNDAADNITAGTSDTIMVPAGTYNLTWQAGTSDVNANLVTHLEILGPVTVIGDTSGGGVVINGGNNDTIFTINPGTFGSFNPSGNTYVFNLAFQNLTIENGTNKNNPVDSTTNLSNNVGGCVNWDASGSGNFTITNTVIKNCTILWGPGGGIWAFNSAGGTGTLTLSGDTIQDNSTPEEGGGLYIAFTPVAVSATNTVFTGNKADATLNSSDGGAFGAGGGLFFSERQPPPDTPQSTLTNVTISSNIAAQDNGGGIYTSSGLLISSSLFQSNSAAAWGGGIHSEVATPEVQTTITSSNFLSNSATITGGAISGGTAPAADGNILQVSLSRIFGNTSTGGASGLAAGASGNQSGEVLATENWWGCNGGPTTPGDGCDQAVLYDPTTGSLTTAPYAQLGFSSDVTSIPPAGSMNLTVSLNQDSNNNPISGAFPAVATNYPYTYNVTGVTTNPVLTTGTFNTAGLGTAVLTPTTTGNGTVTVTFDNQTDTINFTTQAATATSLALAANPSFSYTFGYPLTVLTVQLTPVNATGITASNFTVTVDGSSAGYSLSLLSNNNYQISGPYDILPVGNHTLAVTFMGTANYAGSTTSATLMISKAPVGFSSQPTPANPVQGQGGTLTVNVNELDGNIAPTGTVTCAFNNGSGQTATLSNGSANIPIPAILPTGVVPVTCSYSGDANYNAVPTATSNITIFGRSLTTIASLTATTAQIDVFGLGFTPPSGQLAFNDATTASPVTGPVTLNTSTATPSLLPQVTTSTGANSLPVWTELNDLNGDGILDLITSVFGLDSVLVQLGNGDGTFGAATTILIANGFGPAEVHAVSLRGNGTLDIIAGSFNTNQVAVLLGNGNGTFQPAEFYTVGSAANTPTSITTGDFNQDGNLDVAAADTEDNTVSILAGNGSGSLTLLGAPISVGRVPEAIRAGDFNSDGYPDLATANYQDGTVTILLNNQDETFTASTVTAGTGPQALAITGSGANLLLAVANFGSNNVSVLQSNNNGTFAAPKLVNVGRGPDEVRFADVNGDSVPDLVVANYTDGTLSVATGGAALSYTVLGPFTIGTKPYSAAAGDLNQDGTPDIVAANCFSNNTGALLGGTQISVPYTGLSLPAGNTLNATYSPDANSKYGASTSPNVTAP